jgi:UDP-2-acetamido-2,6-beta-L-arabino-hexul-4-ose reductase
MNILVTGAKGFLGRHLVIGLEARGHKVLTIDIDTNLQEWKDALSMAEFVYHLAGVNRPKEIDEFQVGNVQVLEQLLDGLLALGKSVPIMLSSSIQAEIDNPYGKSKLEAENVLSKWVLRYGGVAHIYRFPNLFGKWVRPDYNSVIATFCDRIAKGQDYVVNDRATILNLNYVDDVIESLCELIGINVPAGSICRHSVNPLFCKSLGEIVDLIIDFKDGRLIQQLPQVADPFVKRLYSTYLTYVPFNDIPVRASLKHDERGWLFELIKSQAFGQIFVSTTKPGITRGNHWHNTKVERFCLIRGTGVIKFRQVKSSDIIALPISDTDIKIVDIPPGYTHSITNTGSDDMIVLFWANEVFDPIRPDTYFLKVEQ